MQALLFLIGFMGAGKSTVGPIVARRWGWQFADSDAVLAANVGQSIESIFEHHGERAFRQHETQTLQTLCQQPQCVVAVGGGAPTVEANWAALNRGITVYLQLPLAQLQARLCGAPRPLLNGLTKEEKLTLIDTLFAQRRAFYERADLTVNADQPPESVADAIIEQVPLCSAFK